MTDQQISELLKLKNQLCFPFYAASRLITQAYAPKLAKLKITYPQYLVLMVLWEKDEQSVKEIGEKLFLDSGTLTPVLKKLVQNGFLVRKRDGKDNRLVWNALTLKGKKLKLKAAKMSLDLFCKTGLNIEEANKVRTSTKDFILKVATSKALSSVMNKG